MDFSRSDPTSRTGAPTGPPTSPATGRPTGQPVAGDVPKAEPAAPRDVGSAIGTEAPAGRGGWWRLIRLWALRLAVVCVGLLGLVLGLMVLYRFVAPPTTPTLAVSQLLGGSVDRRWVTYERISPHLVRAVLASEDARFCIHYGVDFGELRAAIQDARQGHPRGASTITMQVVKNVFLWPSRSYVRKAIELPLALVLDALWPKRRIMEVYLNIAEWGEGLYGAEAAAQRYFGKSAAALTEAEAARLAVSLPSPAERDAGEPDETVERLAERLLARMRGRIPLGCLR